MATIQVEERFIDNGNGHVLSSCWYQPGQEPAGVVLVAPAMGVPQRFYTDFANWLAGQGYLAVTFDYLGMGRSRRMPLRQLDVDILDWGRHDCSAVLAAAAEVAGGLPLYWIGHSVGAQILPLVDGHERLTRIVTIAAGSATGARTARRSATRPGCSGMAWRRADRGGRLLPRRSHRRSRRPARRGDSPVAALVSAPAIPGRCRGRARASGFRRSADSADLTVLQRRRDDVGAKHRIPPRVLQLGAKDHAAHRPGRNRRHTHRPLRLLPPAIRRQPLDAASSTGTGGRQAGRCCVTGTYIVSQSGTYRAYFETYVRVIPLAGSAISDKSEDGLQPLANRSLPCTTTITAIPRAPAPG